MEKPYILHMLTPAKNVSPFDVNMALDAGWTAVVPYMHVELDDIAALGDRGCDVLARAQECETHWDLHRWP